MMLSTSHSRLFQNDAIREMPFPAATMRTVLIVAGLVLLTVGLAWPLITRLGLGRLPGDIVVERGNFRFYFPIVTSLILSGILTLVVWLFRR